MVRPTARVQEQVTSAGDRTRLFTSSYSGENIAAGRSTPRSTFYQWWHEATSSPECTFTIENGHRWNIAGGHSGIGMGHIYDSASTYRYYWAHDFSGTTARKGLVAGAHEKVGGTKTVALGDSAEFRANFYDDSKPSAARVNVGGTCYTMAEERFGVVNGVNTITYLATVSITATCTRYRFEFLNSAGDSTEFLPAIGSYGIGDSSCADYSTVTPNVCSGSGTTGTTGTTGELLLSTSTSSSTSSSTSGVIPTTGACTPLSSCPNPDTMCGNVPDGCGGTVPCSGCSSNQTQCIGTTCTCMPATCASLGKECDSGSGYPDGCGGTTGPCGTCTDSKSCVDGTCVAASCGGPSESCAQLGYTCGNFSSNCTADPSESLLLTCGTCPANFDCVNNQCSCTPLSKNVACSDSGSGLPCGSQFDGCNNFILCDSCTGAGSLCLEAGYCSGAVTCGENYHLVGGACICNYKSADRTKCEAPQDASGASRVFEPRALPLVACALALVFSL